MISWLKKACYRRRISKTAMFARSGIVDAAASPSRCGADSLYFLKDILSRNIWQ
jgi:hypothetical protein